VHFTICIVGLLIHSCSISQKYHTFLPVDSIEHGRVVD
jgi:hypothetical protein